MKRPAIIALSVAVLTLASSASFAGKKDLQEEIEELKAGQQQIQKDLAEIKKLLAARPAAAPTPARAPKPTVRRGANVKDVVFDLGDNPVKGESTAKLTLVEFSDYQ